MDGAAENGGEHIQFQAIEPIRAAVVPRRVSRILESLLHIGTLSFYFILSDAIKAWKDGAGSLHSITLVFGFSSDLLLLFGYVVAISNHGMDVISTQVLFCTKDLLFIAFAHRATVMFAAATVPLWVLLAYTAMAGISVLRLSRAQPNPDARIHSVLSLMLYLSWSHTTR